VFLQTLLFIIIVFVVVIAIPNRCKNWVRTNLLIWTTIFNLMSSPFCLGRFILYVFYVKVWFQSGNAKGKEKL